METAYTINKIEDFDQVVNLILDSNTYPILLLLNGDLGAGKTTFVKYLGAKLGIKHEINSPSFIIHNEYKDEHLTLHHLDLYRLEDEQEIRELKLENLLSNKNIIAIEWAEKFESFLKSFIEKHKVKTITLELEHINENARSLKVTI